MTDFFDDPDDGHDHNFMKYPKLAKALDVLCNARSYFHSQRRYIDQYAATVSPQNILVVGVEVADRGNALKEIAAELARSRHYVSVSLVQMQAKGKFENIDDAISAVARPLADFDWMIIVDDDVVLPPRFLDRYIAAVSLSNLSISQPAHRFLSYNSFKITRRRFGSVVRRTNFVEIGPLTVIRRDVFAELIPFPASRWAYGLDVLWGELARRNGWRMGVVDMLPIRHLKPVGGGYSMQAAVDEGRMLLKNFDVSIKKAELFKDHAHINVQAAGGDLKRTAS